MTRVTVVDQFVESTPRHHSRVGDIEDAEEPARSEDLNSRVLKAIRRDPFASIRELKRELNRRPGTPLVGWWQVFAVLRRHHLLQKRSRFRYVRNRDLSSF